MIIIMISTEMSTEINHLVVSGLTQLTLHETGRVWNGCYIALLHGSGNSTGMLLRMQVCVVKPGQESGLPAILKFE
jgi:hypothetical protein